MTQLIPLAYLNEACFLSLNVDEKKYNMVLKIAQEDLEDILGKEFYAEIVGQYEDEPHTLSAVNLTLYDDYIKDFLAWDTYYHYLKFANSDSTPTGERKFNEENSSLLTDIEMYSKEKNILSQVNRYKYRLINHLKLEQAKDSTAFPKWEDNCKEHMSFAISSVSKDKNAAIIRVNRSITTNE